MNMRCRSPEQHRRKGTTNSHTGNSTSTSLCTTSSPSLSSVCRRGGEGEGALWFRVLWVILPHPAPVVPCLVVPCAPAPPRWPRREAELGGAVTRMTYDCLLEREAWLGGGGGAYHVRLGGAGPATRRRGTIYPHMMKKPSSPLMHPKLKTQTLLAPEPLETHNP